MAASFTKSIDLHCSINVPKTPDLKHPFFFTNCFRYPTKKSTILCASSKSQPKFEETPKNPSLSDQLKPLFTKILPENGKQVLKKPSKSTWVNNTKPKPSVLSHQRQKRIPYSFNPRIRELKLIAKKLNDYGFDSSNEEDFISILEEIPQEMNRENALVMINALRPWEKTLAFFNWVKTKNLFPMETVFYNVTMKSLTYGGQFKLIEGLANEMIGEEIELNNITYSTIITCAKRCNLFDKALEWFERMYKTGVMPDDITYNAVLGVYGKMGKVQEVMILYERRRASGWMPDQVAFSILCKMFGEAGDYDGIRFVLEEMKSLDVQPNLVVYNTLLVALGKAGKPSLAKSLFEEMIESGVKPDVKTLTSLIYAYGKAGLTHDALKLWERMRSNGWPTDFFLYNALLSMFADLGLEEEAERLFEDMKHSDHCRPDGFTYTAMINIYSTGGKIDRAMELLTEMNEVGVKLNVMACTCLMQCLGRSKRIDDLVRIFEVSIERGIKPDDRLCGCLLSVVSLCDDIDDANKVLRCLERSNQKLVSLISLINAKETKFEMLKEEFKAILNDTDTGSRRVFCNCMIDICRNWNLQERAYELLYLGSIFKLYPGLHNKTGSEWSLDLRSLSVGAALTAFEDWMITMSNVVERQEALPQLFTAITGSRTRKFSQGLATVFASRVEELGAPFRLSEDRAGCFVATRDELVSWVQCRDSSPTLTV